MRKTKDKTVPIARWLRRFGRLPRAKREEMLFWEITDWEHSQLSDFIDTPPPRDPFAYATRTAPDGDGPRDFVEVLELAFRLQLCTRPDSNLARERQLLRALGVDDITGKPIEPEGAILSTEEAAWLGAQGLSPEEAWAKAIEGLEKVPKWPAMVVAHPAEEAYADPVNVALAEARRKGIDVSTIEAMQDYLRPLGLAFDIVSPALSAEKIAFIEGVNRMIRAGMRDADEIHAALRAEGIENPRDCA